MLDCLVMPVSVEPQTTSLHDGRSRVNIHNLFQSLSIYVCFFTRRVAFLLGATVLFGAFSSAHAQLSVDSIGMDTSQNEAYQCVRYTDVAQNTISVINADNQESSLTIKQAKKRIQKSIKRANKRKKRLSEKLNRLKQELKEIKTKLIPRPGTIKKIKKLKKAIKRTKKARRIVIGQKKNLLQLRKQVVQCGKEEALTGGLVIQTVTWPSFLHDGAYTSYHIGIYYNLVRTVSLGESFCVRRGDKPGVSRLYTVVNPCPARFSDYSCAAQHFGISGLAVGGVSGTDYFGEGGANFCIPGDPDYHCDLAAAQAEASRIAGAVGTITVLGKASSSTGCERFE